MITVHANGGQRDRLNWIWWGGIMSHFVAPYFSVVDRKCYSVFKYGFLFVSFALRGAVTKENGSQRCNFQPVSKWKWASPPQSKQGFSHSLHKTSDFARNGKSFAGGRRTGSTCPEHSQYFDSRSLCDPSRLFALSFGFGSRQLWRRKWDFSYLCTRQAVFHLLSLSYLLTFPIREGKFCPRSLLSLFIDILSIISVSWQNIGRSRIGTNVEAEWDTVPNNRLFFVSVKHLTVILISSSKDPYNNRWFLVLPKWQNCNTSKAGTLFPAIFPSISGRSPLKWRS